MSKECGWIEGIRTVAYLKIVFGVKASGPPHVIKVVFGVKTSGPPHV